MRQGSTLAVLVDPAGLTVLLLHNIDPHWLPQEQEEAARAAKQLGDALAGEGYKTVLLPVTHGDLSSALCDYSPDEVVVFNWCESLPGVPRSEWLVTGVLECLGYTFTGSSSATLAFSQHKPRVKRHLSRKGIPTPEWMVCDRAKSNGWNRFPAIVKASFEHCSEGITREAVVNSPREMEDRVAYVLDTFKQPALIEDFVDGREFHVSLWGNGQVTMLPPAEMDFSAFTDYHDRLCTYDAKFLPGSEPYEKIQTLQPAPLAEAELQELERTAFAAYTAIGCRDYGRIDIRLRDGVYYVLDVNPNADISIDASMACGAELAGYSYGALGGCLVGLAAARRRQGAHRKTVRRLSSAGSAARR